MARGGRAPAVSAASVAVAAAAAAAVLLLLTALLRGSAQPAVDVLIVGRLTADVRADRGGGAWTGGAVAFAAATVRALGLRACVLTAAAPDADVTRAFDGAEFTVRPVARTLTFEHTECSDQQQRGVRALRILAGDDGAPLLLSMHDVPDHCRAVRLILLGPLLPGDIDVPSFLGAATPPIGLIAQGLQRAVGERGEVSVLPHPSQQLTRAAGPGVSIFLSEEETAGWADGELEALAAACERVVITRGEAGATEFTAAGGTDIPAAPGASAHAVDSVGAGDTFAAAFMVARELRPRADPGRLAAEVAAAAVALQHGSLNPAFGAAAALAAARSEPRRALLQSALTALRRASMRWLAAVSGDSRVEL